MRSGILILDLPYWTTQTAMAALLVFAWWKGGPAERFVATSLVITVEGFARLEFLFDDTNSIAGYVRALLRDLLQASIFFAVALRSNRYWTIGMASIGVVSVVISLVQLLAPVASWTFWTAEWALFYLAVFTNAAGVAQAWQARGRGSVSPAAGR